MRFLNVEATAMMAACVTAPVRPAQFNFRCSSNLTSNHPATIRMAQMFAAIERQSEGAIHTDFFPNSQLGGDLATLSQLRLGALDFMVTSPASLASVVPVVDIAFLGFAFKDADEGLRALDGPLHKYLNDECGAKGIYLFETSWPSGMLQVGSASHAIRKPEDFRGFKIRVGDSRIQGDLFKELGATPVGLGFAEVYSGLQTKLIDGEIGPLVSIETARWYEVEKYVSLTNHSWGGNWMIGNGKTWSSIPPDLQKVIAQNHTKFALLEQKDIAGSTAPLLAMLRGQGTEINDVDQQPFRAQLRSYYQDWQRTFGPTAWGLLESSIKRKLL